MHVVYADESGQPGPNYLADPPVFVMAGWVVPPDKEAHLAEAVREMREAHVASGGKGKDRKFGQDLAREANRRGLAQMVGKVLDLGCVPVIEAWGLRFGIATRIVKELLDSDWNPVAASTFHEDDMEKRQELTSFIFERISVDCLDQFAEAYKAKGGNVAALEAARARLVEELGSFRRLEEQEAFRACDLTEMMAHMRSLDEAQNASAEEADGAPVPETIFAMTSRAHRIVNLPAFTSFLRLAEGELGRRGVRGVLRYDEGVYSAPFRGMFDVLRLAAPPFGIRNLTALEMVPSELPGIQVADALAAAVRWSLLNPADLEPSGPLRQAMTRIFHPGDGSPDPVGRSISLKVSKDMRTKFHEPMLLMPWVK